MRTTNTLIIGGGQAGLALSRCLTALGCDHLVIERGRIAERWHSERWDSLRLLTPNWMTRLPGWTYDGPDPDGFMTASEVASFFDRYAASFAAPVHQHTTVQHVTTDAEGFMVTTSDGTFRSDNVVIATGWCDQPAIPAVSPSTCPANPPGGPGRVPQPRRCPHRRCARRGRVRHRSATRRRAAPQRPPRDRRGRQPQPDSTPISGPGHLPVARRDRGVRQDHRRRRRCGCCPQRAVTATGGPRRSPHPRPRHVAGRRRPPRRPTERRGRNPGHARHQPGAPSSTPPTARRPGSSVASTPPSIDSA